MRNDHNGVFEGTVRIREEARSSLFSQNALQVLNLVFQTVLSQVSAWAFVHIFTSAFGLTVSELPFFFVTLAISIIMLFLVRGQKIGIILLVAGLIIGITVLIIRRERVIAECAGLYVNVVRAFTSYYGYVSEVGLDIETSYNVTYVMTCFAFLPVWQVSYSYGKHTYPSLLTIFLLLPLFLCIIGGQNPSVISVAVMALCILALYFTCMTESINTDHEMTDRVRKRIRFILITLAAVLTAVLMAIAARAIFPGLRSKFNDASAVYTSHFFRDLLADIPGNPLDISKTGLSEGELQRAGSVQQTGEIAFEISYEKDNPRVTYLRNFTGDAYTGSKWAAAETELPSALIPSSVTYPSIYSPNVSTSIDAYRNPLLYYQASALSAIYQTADRDNVLTITGKGSGNYLYLPYGLNGAIRTGTSFASFKVYSDLYGIGGEKQATYPVYTAGSLLDVLDLIKGNEFYEGLSQPNGDVLVRYMDAEALSKLLHEYGTEMSAEEILESSYSEYVIKAEDDKKLHYRPKERCLSAYESYVRQHDLQVPDSARIREVADALAEQYGIDVNAREYVKAVLAVQNYLSAQCDFDEHPGAIGSDRDFIETFLFEKQAGYCVHFATAGTVLLRMLGVPARYAEGFLAAPVNAGESILVTDYDAHAWTEIFIDGYGWYPIEMTPSDVPEPETESESETEPAGMEEETEAEGTESATETETTEAAGTIEQEADNDDPTEHTKPKKSYIGEILLGILALLLIAGAAFLIYRKRRIRPLDKLKGLNSRDTYLNVYREVQRQAGRRRNWFTIDDSPEKLSDIYPLIDADTLSSVQKNAKEAFYSRNEVPDEAIEELYTLYAEKRFEEKQPQPEAEEEN